MPNPYSEVLQQQEYIPRYAPAPIDNLSRGVEYLNQEAAKGWEQYDELSGTFKNIQDSLTEGPKRAAQTTMQEYENFISDFAEEGNAIHAGPTLRRKARELQQDLAPFQKRSEAHRQTVQQIQESEHDDYVKNHLLRQAQEADLNVHDEEGNLQGYAGPSVPEYVNLTDMMSDFASNFNASSTVTDWKATAGGRMLTRYAVEQLTGKEVHGALSAHLLNDPKARRQLELEMESQGRDPYDEKDLATYVAERTGSHVSALSYKDVDTKDRVMPDDDSGGRGSDRGNGSAFLSGAIPMDTWAGANSIKDAESRIADLRKEGNQEEADYIEHQLNQAKRRAFQDNAFSNKEGEEPKLYDMTLEDYEKYLRLKEEWKEEQDEELTPLTSADAAAYNFGMFFGLGKDSKKGRLIDSFEKRLKEEGLDPRDLERIDQTVEEAIESGETTNFQTWGIDPTDRTLTNAAEDFTESYNPRLFKDPSGRFDQDEIDDKFSKGTLRFQGVTSEGHVLLYDMDPDSDAKERNMALELKNPRNTSLAPYLNELGLPGDKIQSSLNYHHLRPDGKSHKIFPGSKIPYKARQTLDGRWKMEKDEDTPLQVRDVVEKARETINTAEVDDPMQLQAYAMEIVNKIGDVAKTEGVKVDREGLLEMLMQGDQLVGSKRKKYNDLINLDMSFKDKGTVGEFAEVY